MPGDRYTHVVYLSFFAFWRECAVPRTRPETPLPRTFHLQHTGSIRELACRRGALGTLEAQEQLDREIANGRGGLYLDLSPEQYRHLAAG
jgi:hypothetical protein